MGILHIYGIVVGLFPWLMCGLALIYFVVKVDVALHLFLLPFFILLGVYPLFSFFIVPDFEFVRYHSGFFLILRMVSRLMCLGFCVLNVMFKSRWLKYGYSILLGVILTDCFLSLLFGRYIGP